MIFTYFLLFNQLIYKKPRKTYEAAEITEVSKGGCSSLNPQPMISIFQINNRFLYSYAYIYVWMLIIA